MGGGVVGKEVGLRGGVLLRVGLEALVLEEAGVRGEDEEIGVLHVGLRGEERAFGVGG